VAQCEREKPVLIGACDTALLWDKEKFNQLVDNPQTDCVVFSFRNHPLANKNPSAYGWLAVDSNNRVKKISVKKPLHPNPEDDLLIVGSFWFKKPEVFQAGYEYLLKHQIRVNNEFYVDSLAQVLLELGYCVVSFEVLEYLCFGTPEELDSFLYWQKFFSKVKWHPYEMFNRCPLL
jgi:dTDP-glucose pyrophosphorylase